MIEWIIRKIYKSPASALKSTDRRKDLITRKILNTLDEFGAKFQYYEAIIQSCQDCIARASLDGRILFANRAYSQVFCGVDDVTACDNILFFDQVHEKDIDNVKADIEEIQKPPYRLIRDHRVYDFKGDVRAFNWHVAGILDSCGKVVEIQCIGREFPNYVQWGKLEDFTL